jgi:hypothetical protein
VGRHRRAHLPHAPLTTLAPPPSFSACPRRRMATHRPTSSVFEGLLRRAGSPSALPSYSRAALNLATPRSRPYSRAARCARFACNQRYSEVIRGHSAATQRPSETLSGHQWPFRGHSEGTQRARRGHQGHSVAIRGLSEASQRHAERPSEAIRGQSEALTGHQRALRGHPWPSFAISSTQAHSVAIKRAPGPKTATMATSRAERAPCACACARVRST